MGTASVSQLAQLPTLACIYWFDHCCLLSLVAMPELPEVETMCRGIAAIVGCKIACVERTPCRCRPIKIQPRIDRFCRRTQTTTISAITRLGKRVVIWLASAPSPGRACKGRAAKPHAGQAIVIEPRMTGLVLLSDPPDNEHLRLRIRLVGGPPSELFFWDRRGLGTVSLYSAEEFAARFERGKNAIGPDPLSLGFEELRNCLNHRRRPIKVALLDQRDIAGIGNLYASEILHASGIHPSKRTDRLRLDDWKRMHGAIQQVLKAAIRYEGSTLADGTYRNAQNLAGNYQNHHRVYDRAGERCLTCGRAEIRRIVQAQRSTYYCPNCQTR
jgi:formamidopyrimidine-DNA glycosylase